MPEAKIKKFGKARLDEKRVKKLLSKSKIKETRRSSGFTLEKAKTKIDECIINNRVAREESANA